MKALKSLGRKFKTIVRKEKGSALVIALIIMLALTLLGLSLLLQSNTEYVISLNERDSTAALYNAEAGLQLTRQRLRNFLGSNLTDALDGPNAVDPNDNGVIAIRNPSLTDPDQLNATCPSATCEQSESAIVTLDGNFYEVFRIGVDNSNPADNIWDGPRGLVYVRIEDNYDDKPALNNKWVDTDRRVNAHVISQYPIQVDANGSIVGTGLSKIHTLRAAGTSTRQLIARFGPAQIQPAIVTEGNMNLSGSLDVCGACGAVHANMALTIGDNDVDICSDATATGAPPTVDPSAQIGGTAEVAPPIDVPTANPFHENYVPQPDWFDTMGDPEFTGSPAYPLLQCDYDAISNPHVSKFFALVGNATDGLVYKAYWRNNRWEWELIDDLSNASNTILDDCGRVTNNGDHPIDTNAGAPVNDGRDREFYEFTYGDGGGGDPACNASNDLTLGPTSGENNYVDRTVAIVGGAPAGVLFPGTLPNGSDPDITDYDASLAYGKNRHLWSSNGDVWSPLYNAVVFVWGNVNINGGPTTLESSAGLGTLPGGVWRMTIISLGNIDVEGHPSYAPFRSQARLSDYQWLFISGRDIELAGTPGSGDICPVGNCTNPPANLAGYSGAILAHEQLGMTGNVTINGIVKSEDAAHCANLQTGEGMVISGSVQVYYDCVSPPDTSNQNVRMRAWEEVQ